ncbi:MAG: ZmpA/ZmpB/ZmpC family metallo-endopeptidase-related protein [Lachnospiraceae bacterium]
MRFGEDYSNGFTNQAVLDYNMNFMKEYGRDSSIMSNLTPERISDPEGFKSFYKEVFETIYTLDYLQGMAYLQLTPEQQARITLQHSYAEKTGTWTYVTTTNNSMVSTWNRVSDTQLEQMKLKTLDDLWDNQLTIRPGHRYDLVSSNLVGSNDLGAYNLDRVSFASWYVPYFNEGSPNAQTFRRNGFELGGLFGYSDGLVAYLSGETKVGDLAHYQSLFGSDFTFEKYRKEKNKEIGEKLQAQKLEPNPLFDEDALIEYFKQAMINPGYEMNQVSSKGTSLQNIRDARENVYRYLQRITDDFSSPIYDTGGIAVQYISTAQELVERMNENPEGFFVLNNDISMEGITPQGEVYLNQTFIGKINGNGYKITGLTRPLFTQVVNSYISNLTLEKSDGTVNNSLLAKNVSMSIRVQEEKSFKEVGSLKELQEIGKNTYDYYVLTADIDASQAEGKVIIPGTFSSVLEGKGHKIYGLRKPLFENISGGHLKDVVINDVSIETNAQVQNPAVITLRSNNAAFSNIDLSDIELKGRDYAGVVTGTDRQGSTFSRIQIRNAKVEAEGISVGIFAGRMVNSQIEDVAIIESQVSVSKKEIGGFIGNSIGVDISRVYSQVDLTVNSYTQEEAEQIGGFIGVLGSNSTLNQVISEAQIRAGETDVDLTPISRFVGKTGDNVKAAQAYEYETAGGQSQVGGSFGEGLKPFLMENKKNPGFYSGIGFKEEVWNLSYVEMKGYPELYGMERQQVYTISSWDELLRLEAYPNASFVLAGDLNAAESGAKEVIIQEFSGSLDGNGYSITGLSVPLFGKLKGEVKNLGLKNSQLTTRAGREEGLLAESLEKARIVNLLLQDVRVTSADRAGLLAGSSKESYLENILVINSNMQADSFKGSGFLLKASGTTMLNIWQQVEVQKEGGEAASFLQEDLGQNTIQGVVIAGNLPEDTDKFSIGTDSDAKNVYVFSESSGNVTADMGAEVIGNGLWSQEFYSATLGLDQSEWDISSVTVLGYPVLKVLKDTEGLEAFAIRLSTREDLEKLNRLPGATFVLTKDISLDSRQGVLVSETFTGKLYGEGHTLSHLQAPLFEDFRGEVENLHVENASIVNTDGGANLLAKSARGAKVTDVFFYGISLQGKERSAIVGTDEASVYDRVGVRGLTLKLGGGTSGSLIGEATGTRLTNLFTSDVYLKSEELQADWEFIGGLIGKASSIEMKDIYSENYLELPLGEGNPNISALIGGMGDASSKIQNGVSAGGILPHDPNRDKFVYLTDIQSSNLNGLVNCYINESTGGKNLAAGGLNKVTQATLKTSTFYQNTVAFDQEIWNFQALSSTGMPMLSKMKNIRIIPPGHGFAQEDYDTPLLQENVPAGYIGITNADDLLQIKNNPNGKYILMDDISVYSLDAADSFLGNFGGELDGNGQVIADIHDAPLFATLTGTVRNLTLKNARVEKYELSEGASVLTKQIRAGVVEKVKLESVHVSGGSNTGALAGVVNQKSRISEIWAKDLVVNEVGPTFDPYVQKNVEQVGGLIGRLENSTMTYVYAGGRITLNGHKQGGIVGSIAHDTYGSSYSGVEQVISNMTVKSTLPLREGYITYKRGGLVGEISWAYGTKWMKNCLAIGEAKENAAIGSLYPSFVFGYNSGQALDGLTNCYEAQGVGTASGSGYLTTIAKDGLTEDFYLNTLKLDTSIWNLSTIGSEGIPILSFVQSEGADTVVPNVMSVFSRLAAKDVEQPEEETTDEDSEKVQEAESGEETLEAEAEEKDSLAEEDSSQQEPTQEEASQEQPSQEEAEQEKTSQDNSTQEAEGWTQTEEIKEVLDSTEGSN